MDNGQHLESFYLIWLDANVKAKEIQNTEQKLRSIINQLERFNDVAKCKKYIEERLQQDRLVLIVSGQTGREIVPCIHELRQVISIYVYCMNQESNKQWASKFTKIKAVVIDLNDLVTRIKADHKVQKKIEEPLSVNFFSTSADKEKSTTGLNGQFLFSQVLNDCLLRLNSTKMDRKELIDRCEKQYKGNTDELNNIQDFQKEYSSDKVLWWYTKESFFYKTLNNALRTQDIHMIFLFREFITDIYHQLQRHQAKHSLRIYRSQMISNNELENLKERCGQLISINAFFSTSTSYQGALSFLEIPHGRHTLKPVLFEIEANPQIVSSKPFADISTISEYSDECEVLFMLGSIFRLNQVKYNQDDQVWIIKMILCSDDEHDLKHILKHMKKQLGTGQTNLQILGNFLCNMGKFDLAEKYFIRLLDQLPLEHPQLSTLYEDLAKVASQNSNYDKYIKWQEKALKLKESNQLIKSSAVNKANTSIDVVPASLTSSDDAIDINIMTNQQIFPEKVPKQTKTNYICDRIKLAKEFVTSLQWDNNLFDSSFDKCYCKTCYRFDCPNVIEAGNDKYIIPRGWVRLGLQVDQNLQLQQDIWNSWPITFHGASLLSAKSIIYNGQFCLPGDKLIDGTELIIVHGSSPTKHYIYTSPTIAYASLPVYSPKLEYRSSKTNIQYEVQIVLQCRQKPMSFTVQNETVGAGSKRICRYVTNDKIEYFTEMRASLIAYGLLVKINQVFDDASF